MSDIWMGDDPEELMEKHKKYMTQLAELLADMCCNAALIFEAKKTVPLNPVQLDEILTKEFRLIVEDNILDKNWSLLIYKLAEKRYKEASGR